MWYDFLLLLCVEQEFTNDDLGLQTLSTPKY